MFYVVCMFYVCMYGRMWINLWYINVIIGHCEKKDLETNETKPLTTTAKRKNKCPAWVNSINKIKTKYG